MSMDCAVLRSDFQKKASPPFRGSPGGGRVLNEFIVQGDTAYVTLLNRYDDSFSPVVVEIDTDDLSKMDEATDKYWQYVSPGNSPRGVYLPSTQKPQMLGLAHLLQNSPRGMWRLFKDGDPLNCKRSNLAILNRPPFQVDWLWNSPLPVGFTLIKKLENSIVVRAKQGADNRLMWQYLLERWQFCRSKGIHINVPRIHESRTSWTQRITAIVCRDSQTYSFDIGEDGAKEWQQYETCEPMREAA